MEDGLGVEGRELLLEQLAVLGRFVETLVGCLHQAPPQPGDRLALFLELPIQTALLETLLKATQPIAVLIEIDPDGAAQPLGAFAVLGPQIFELGDGLGRGGGGRVNVGVGD